MLIDVSLMNIYEKAMNGDKKASFDLAYAFNFGKGAAKDESKAREIMIKLVDDEEKDIFSIEYGRLYKIVGHFFGEVNNSRKAKEYFMKAKNFILETYIPDYAKELIEKYDLDALILKHS